MQRPYSVLTSILLSSSPHSNYTTTSNPDQSSSCPAWFPNNHQPFQTRVLGQPKPLAFFNRALTRIRSRT